MPAPKPENVGDIYLVRDYPASGLQTYGVAYRRRTEGQYRWVLETQDGDLHWWSEEHQRWVTGADDEEQFLVRRNEWPNEPPDAEAQMRFRLAIPGVAQSTPRAKAHKGQKAYYEAPARGSKLLDYASYKELLVNLIWEELMARYPDWPQDRRYALKIIVYQRKAKRDLDNMAKAVADAAQGLLWANDVQVDVLVVFRRIIAKGADEALEIHADVIGGTIQRELEGT